MAKMVLVFGLSASGKTEFARNYAKKNGYLYFNPDDFYALLNGDECIHENEFEVWMTLYRAIHMAEVQNKDIMVDTDAPTRAHRSQFIDWFPTFEHHLVYIFTNEELRWENNASRRRIIPKNEMERQLKRFESFSKEEEEWKSGDWLTYSMIENLNNKNYKVWEVLKNHSLKGEK